MASNQSATSSRSRSRGALYGLYIGDALAMPVHWYYDRLAFQRDYGYVRDNGLDSFPERWVKGLQNPPPNF
jgi:ADP-ribosylglycohydrolase